MNKGQLVEAIHARMGDDTPRKTVEQFVDAFVDTVGETLRDGERVSLVGFGTFEVRVRAARTGRNPQTGKTMKIKATKSPAFKAGSGLKQTVAGKRKKATGKKATAKKAAGGRAAKKAPTTSPAKAASRQASAKKAGTKKAGAKKAGTKKAGTKKVTGKKAAKKR